MRTEPNAANSIVVIPCFNEEKRLQSSLFVAFAASRPSMHILFVNDGSTDGTAEVLAGMHHALPDQIDICTLEAHSGKAEAVRQGFLRAFKTSPAFVGYFDADLATPLSEIDVFEKILKDQPDTEMVIGVRSTTLGKTERGFLRHSLGNFFAAVSSFLFELPVYDTQCGAKMFRSSSKLCAVFEKPFDTTWLFDIEIFARLLAGRKPGVGTVCSHLIPHWKDIGGSKLTWKDYLRSCVQFWALYWAYPTLRSHRLSKT